MATTIDWDGVNSVVVKDGNGNTLGTDPEIWCNGKKQWPVDIPVAAPYQTGQTGGVSSGVASFNIGLGTAGVSSIADNVASDTYLHYATISIADGYCWADGYAYKSRSVSYRLSKTSVTFTLDSGLATTSYTVSGFSSDGGYDWEDAIDSGALSGFAYVEWVTTSKGMSVLDSSGDKVHKSEIIESGTYTVVKNHRYLQPRLSFSDGLFEVSMLSGYTEGADLSYEWRWSNGTLMSGSTGPTWHANMYYIPDMDKEHGYLKVTVTAAETDEFYKATASCSIDVACFSTSMVKSSAESTKARMVTIDGTDYCVWVMPASTRQKMGYTRYAIRRSSNTGESSWGKDTYWRQYFVYCLDVDYGDTVFIEWHTMKFNKYSNGSFVYGGYTTGAWFNTYNIRSVNLWVKATSGYSYNYAAYVAGTSEPS